MSGQNVKSVVSGLAVAALLSVAPFASPVASAQDAIMLETIGAVRMAQPDEVRRMAAEQQNARAQAQGQQDREEREASAR